MKKILACLLASLLVFPTFVSCKKNTNIGSNEAVFCNFEQWGPDFQLMRLYDFGIIERDEEVKHGGRYSAKLYPLGSDPCFALPLYSERFGYDYSDLRKVCAINAWLFNPNSETIDIQVGFSGKKEIHTSITRIYNKTFSIKNGWNRINYVLDHAVMELLAEVNAMESLTFTFPDSYDRDIWYADNPKELAKAYYIDDITFIISEQPAEVTDIIQLDKHEVFGFEKNYQNFIFQPMSVSKELMPSATVKSVLGDRLKAKPTEGNALLSLQTRHSTTLADMWPTLDFSGKTIQKAVNALTAEEKAKDVYLCFDVYTEHSLMDLLVVFYTKDELGYTGWTPVKLSHPKGEYVPKFTDDMSEAERENMYRLWAADEWAYVDLTPGKWHRVKINLNFADYNRYFYFPRNNVKWDEAVHSNGMYDFLNNPGYFALSWREYLSDTDAEFYFDNFYFEVE